MGAALSPQSTKLRLSSSSTQRRVLLIVFVVQAGPLSPPTATCAQPAAHSWAVREEGPCGLCPEGSVETSVSGCSSSPARELPTLPLLPRARCAVAGAAGHAGPGQAGPVQAGATSRPRPTPQSVLGPGASPGKQSLAHPAASQSQQQHGAHSRCSEGCHPWTASVCDALRNPGPCTAPG